MSADTRDSSGHKSQGSPEEVRSQRVARLQKLRKKVHKMASKKRELTASEKKPNPETHSNKSDAISKPAVALKHAKHSEIELTVRGDSRNGAGSESHLNIGAGASSSMHHVTAQKSEYLSISRLFVIFFFVVVFIAFPITWISVLHHTKQKLIELDCYRLGSFLPTACMFLLGHLLTSLTLKPQQRPKHSKKRRFLFGWINLVLASTAVLVAAIIGYPQNLCETDCACGACNDTYAVNADAVELLDSHVSQDNQTLQNESFCASGKSFESLKMSGTDGFTVCTGQTLDQSQLPQMCSLRDASKISKVVYSDAVNTDLLKQSLGSLIDTVTKRVADLMYADDNCTLIDQAPVCPNITDNAIWKALRKDILNGISNILASAMCDRSYSFCDKQNKLRRACSSTVCCNLCNLALTLQMCSSSFHEAIFSEIYTYLDHTVDDHARTATTLGFQRESFQTVATILNLIAELFISQVNSTNAMSSKSDSCQLNCHNRFEIVATWYGPLSTCLPHHKRSWYKPLENTSSSVIRNEEHKSVDLSCTCDSKAKSWANTIVGLHGVVFFLVLFMIGLQISLGFIWDAEKLRLFGSSDWNRMLRTRQSLQRCKFGKMQMLVFVLRLLIVGGLITLLQFTAGASRGANCFNRNISMHGDLAPGISVENSNVMASWTIFAILFFLFLKISFIDPVIQWLCYETETVGASTSASRIEGTEMMPDVNSGRSKSKEEKSSRIYMLKIWGASRAESVVHSIKAAKELYNNLFSFSKGQYFLLYNQIWESVEVLNQCFQLATFSSSRTYNWVVALSISIMINGFFVLLPFILAILNPGYKEYLRTLLGIADTTFDIVYLLISVAFMETETLRSESWLVAVLGTIIPILRLTRRHILILRRNKQHRSSLSASDGASSFKTKRTQELKHGKKRQDRSSSIISCISAVNFAICTLIGSLFLAMANEGYSVCNSMLGEILWKSSYPQLVIISTDDNIMALRGACNYTGIKSIVSIVDSEYAPSIDALPESLAKLSMLEDLVVVGHNLNSISIPPQVLDHVSLPRLTRLEFGKNDLVNRHLDLSGKTLRWFPSYIATFMTDLEVIDFGDTNLACFPTREKFFPLKKLSKLNLNGTKIKYLPPFALFSHSKLSISVAETPVSHTLDWSHHGLGNAVYSDQRGIENKTFEWIRLVRTLPSLVSLNLSHNQFRILQDFDLHALPQLKVFDLSHNPELYVVTKNRSSFSWWKTLSTHPSLGKAPMLVNLSNAGLSQGDIRVQRSQNAASSSAALTCNQLIWMKKALVNGQLNISQNIDFESFYSWYDSNRQTGPHHWKCRCGEGLKCAEIIDESIYHLLLNVLPSAKFIWFGQIFQPNIYRYSKIVSFTKLMRSLSKSAFSFHFSYQLLDICRIVLTTVDSKGSLGKAISLLGPQLRSLYLSCIDLSGPMPENIGNLVELQSLKLVSVGMHGAIPQNISSLIHLHTLDLTNNNITGEIPMGLMMLSNLVEIRLKHNKIIGEIPNAISVLSGLESLDLSFNSLQGLIPRNIATLSKLKRLHLSQNNLTGEIPSTISKLTGLTDLDISENMLRGVLPVGITALKKLVHLETGGNANLTGPFPSKVGFVCHEPNDGKGGSLYSLGIYTRCRD